MKVISLYKAIKATISFVLLAILFSAVFYGCKKDDTEFKTSLSIDRRIVRVADTAASTRILVYADGNWNLQIKGDASWVKLDRESGSGKGEFQATVQSNTGNLPRSVTIVVTADHKTDTISLQQRGLVPAINITDANANGIANGGVMKTAIVTNVPFNLMQHAEIYDVAGGTGWISNMDIKGTNLVFTLGQNTSDQPRQAVLRLSYLDALGTLTKDSIVVKQNPKGGYDNALLKDFAYVKTALAAGPITEDIYIEGVIVSDKGNPNMGQNANSATNKHVVDKNENSITSYIQSLDGKSGFRIRAKTGGDNIFGRNEIVRLWLKGVTLKKETNPARVTLDQVQSINVMSKVASSGPVLPREMYMKDLTDEDVYTYVKLKQVEVSIPNGSFFNINEGYILRTDEYPLNIRDIDGNSMYMLTNIDVPYRRDGNHVPEGSGNIGGIVVHEELPRYGGNIGKYSIRHVTREDIDLRQDRNDGFSNVLVEWSRFKTENAVGPTAAKNPLTPDIGTGTLTQSLKSPLDFTAPNGIITTSDFNGLLIESTTVKGIIGNGAWYCNKWWDDAKNTGAWWLITTSTTGITKPISMQIEGTSNIGGPTNFIAEWSATGTDSGTWNLLSEYTLQDQVDYTNTLLTQVPGCKGLNFQFPLAASGLTNLYIRLRVKNKTVGNSTSPSGGTLAATGITRLGHVSIKYNK
ncbi:BACON domain-containing protein [Pedobacter heparinus]|uniref:BACON domain-containing protein n=1 Tax=Pedobacter heparinus (strain ATCC 13125 / DSM 2366 / CIP 104194 / JCM 7457 / NBRC 12017 / NCIMB 9290 / NRRL B-14731 / HIM 762-3) TaxID=485917 RepID=C6XT39_PEDHD|nr:BACON domain-containing carbohydrate-binding protein [Pedobacter heparinus]ACU03600.1 hypothetical protein Phep_1386 [Pedobacter heparinus DSM 2366]